MAVSFGCKCGERKKPVRERNWGVTKWRCHRSAFAGYHTTSSDWSTVVCLNPKCSAIGRTRAAYVDELRHVGLNDRGQWEFK